MFIHFDKFILKKPTKLELILYILTGVFCFLMVGVILCLRDLFPVIKDTLDAHPDMVEFVFLLGVGLIVGVTYVIGQVYRRYIKGVPKCLGCSNVLKRYEIDLIKEKIKCRSCGFESTFYQFPDKIFLHDKFVAMVKDENRDPIIIEKAQELVKKFENFEFDKKK